MQKYTSKQTSINSKKLPAVFGKVQKQFGWKKDSLNVDLGGGKFDNASSFLLDEFNVTSLIYDPYNRPEPHNRQVLESCGTSKCDTVTISNVLNVICEESAQLELLKLAHSILKPEGHAYITVYEGNRSGKGRQTGPDQWQENKKLSEYSKLVDYVFGNHEIKGGMMIAVK
ncbi:hypothetical protein [Vibrio owensii]|uniref:hypothetical protein n=1 Tax=Vibrio owensii TaxID=696485 RepID=UPI003CC668B5